MTEKAQSQEDVSSTSPPFDIYIRFNGDEERDYCFQVTTSTTFGDLIKIFNTLPLNLSPSIFFERLPTHFQISTHPGILTREGGFLFGDRADKPEYTKTMKNEDVIADYAWPGQLIVPYFPDKPFLKYSVVSAMLVWLYTDLPDFISPTPGHSITATVCRFLAYLFGDVLAMPDQAALFATGAADDWSVTAQCVFFFMNLFKVAIIYFSLWVGALNPYSLNFLSKTKLKMVERDDLVAIGWTSAKKAIRYDFENAYRSEKIKKVGGIMNANKTGLLRKLRYSCVVLGEGEGFQTPLDWKRATKTNDNKFHLSYEMIKEQEEHLQLANPKATDIEFAGIYKRYRRFGPFDGPEDIAKAADARIAFGDGNVNEDSVPRDIGGGALFQVDFDSIKEKVANGKALDTDAAAAETTEAAKADDPAEQRLGTETN